ncbi:zinc finger BED domain-containing protein 1 [Elysia marginata]|uniref:Zinc finger BED domain-containing protein 1 n=1 Tax=Elysia marginata TaxID=1093978 RepID=A0AAV4IH52_9GAST|nr:zinc finger BED domain-containing protein 1 [Elysia marginata]
MVETLERITKYKVGSSKKRHLDEPWLDLIVMDMQPLSVVEDRGFRRLVVAPDPRYNIVSRKRLSSQLLPEKYNSMKNRVIEELRSVAHVSLTTDCWTSRANEAYTTIKPHYINDNYPRFKKAGLSTQDSASSAVEKLKEVTRKIRLPSEETTATEEENLDAPPAKKASILWSEYDDEFVKVIKQRPPQRQQLKLRCDGF